MESFVPGQITIGFVGIGMMGTPMSRNLRGAGYAVVGYDLRPEALEAVGGDGVQPAASLADLAGRADVVITMLPDSDAVDAAVLGPNGLAEHLTAGKLIIDMSSSFPSRTLALGEELSRRGIGMLGAPVSGGVSGAVAGTLAIMVGGPEVLFQAAKPMFEQMGKSILHMGEAVDSGHVMKCINNFLSAIHTLSSCEAMALAVKAGLDPERTLEVLSAGTGFNSAVRDKWRPFMLPRSFKSGFTVRLMHKDLAMGCDMARDMGATVFLLNHVRQVFGLGVSKLGPDADQTQMLEIVEEWVGQRVSEPENPGLPPGNTA